MTEIPTDWILWRRIPQVRTCLSGTGFFDITLKLHNPLHDFRGSCGIDLNVQGWRPLDIELRLFDAFRVAQPIVRDPELQQRNCESA